MKNITCGLKINDNLFAAGEQTGSKSTGTQLLLDEMDKQGCRDPDEP